MSVNNLETRPLHTLLKKLEDALDLHPVELSILRDTFTRTEKVLNNDGSIKPQANISGRTEKISITVSGLSNTGDINSATKVVGRTEGLGTTVGNLDATGKLTSTDAIAADGTG